MHVQPQFPVRESFDERRKRWKTEAVERFDRLGFWSRLRLVTFGDTMKVRSENLAPENPKKQLVPLFLFYCNEGSDDEQPHGPDIDYFHGWPGENERLDCSLCQAARLHPQAAATAVSMQPKAA